MLWCLKKNNWVRFVKYSADVDYVLGALRLRCARFSDWFLESARKWQYRSLVMRLGIGERCEREGTV